MTRAAVLAGSLLGDPAAAGAHGLRHCVSMEVLGVSLVLDYLISVNRALVLLVMPMGLGDPSISAECRGELTVSQTGSSPVSSL